MAKGVIINGLSGIWNSYGCIPKKGESVSMRVEESTDSSGQEYESLIDLLGFDKEKHDIGQIADNKLISELIIMLPIIYDLNIEKNSGSPPSESPTTVQEQQQTTVDKCAPCSDPCTDQNKVSNSSYIASRSPNAGVLGLDDSPGWVRYENYFDDNNNQSDRDGRQNFYFSKIDRGFLFKIDPQKINKILGVPDYKDLSIYQIKQILMNKNLDKQNLFVKLMRNMCFYNFPPHLNWLYNKNIPPIVIYSSRIFSILSQQDLANIWQSSMPNIATKPQIFEDSDEYFFEHSLTDEDFFAGYDLINNEYDIKMKIFKVKYRAKNDFLKDVKEEEKFIIPSEDKDWYQYNWPYDYFSLVELLRIDASEVEDNE